jgi:hypothetical protein
MGLPLRRRGRLVALAFLAALALTAVAYATIPDSSGVIHGCYAKSGGALRVIDASVTNCKSGETALPWNASGPAGPSGPGGASGPSGPSGASGPSGPAGTTTVWSEYGYPGYPANAYSSVGAEIAHLTFTSADAGFAIVTTNFAMRIHNATGTDCRVQTQIAPAAGVPDQTAPGFVDQWINQNLPTEAGGGTYLGLNASATRVLPVVIGSNTVYLNGKSDCTSVLLGPVTLTAELVQNNPSASLVTP